MKAAIFARILLAILCLLALAASASAEVWTLTFPDKATCEAFKEKALRPSFSEWKSERETGKAPARPPYTCERAIEWTRDKDGKPIRVPDTVDPRGPKGK
jgi:hypothetical protein